MYIEVAISLFLVWIIWYIVTTYKTRSQMPPGPFPLPFIGNMNLMGHDIMADFDKFAKKYGDIFTLSFPTGDVVVINGDELAREARLTKKDDMDGRLPRLVYPADILFERSGLLFSDYNAGSIFRRKVFKSALHTFGSGVKEAEERVNQAVQNLVEEIEETDGKPFSPKYFTRLAVISEMWRWLSDKKYSVRHPTVISLLEFNRLVVQLFSEGALYRLVPWLSYLPTKFKEDLQKAIDIREKVFTPELQAHRESYTPGVIRDLTDSFLSAYEKEIAKESGKDIGSVEDIKSIMMDVLAAGTDTSSTSVSWFILYMVLNQEVQKKIQDELDREVGRKRMPCREDIKNLHFLQATICEILRCSAVAPYAVHNAIRDTSIQNYKIPKGTTIFINIHTLQRNPNHWAEPNLFRPERFLDENEKFVGWTNFPGFMPFSIGRRQCAGMPLAKMQLLSIASALLHRFKFELPSNVARPTTEYDASISAISISPKDYKVVAKKRF